IPPISTWRAASSCQADESRSTLRSPRLQTSSVHLFRKRRAKSRRQCLHRGPPGMDRVRGETAIAACREKSKTGNQRQCQAVSEILRDSADGLRWRGNGLVDFNEALELADAGRVTHFAQGFG